LAHARTRSRGRGEVERKQEGIERLSGSGSASKHEWMAGRLGDELTLSRLAAEAGMSERSFGRRYQASTGLTPTRAVERLRVEAAHQLLSETRLPLKRIAALRLRQRGNHAAQLPARAGHRAQ